MISDHIPIGDHDRDLDHFFDDLPTHWIYVICSNTIEERSHLPTNENFISLSLPLFRENYGRVKGTRLQQIFGVKTRKKSLSTYFLSILIVAINNHHPSHAPNLRTLVLRVVITADLFQ